jgi:ribosome-binding factor A
LKQHKRRFEQIEFVDPEFVDALCESDSASRSSDRQAQRKTQQFCRQVQRALNLALADSDGLDGMSGLFVEGVSPAPDCGRLLVHVLVSADRSVADAIDALRRAAPRLRAEVAKAITRKRAPELSFAPAFDGGADE